MAKKTDMKNQERKKDFKAEIAIGELKKLRAHLEHEEFLYRLTEKQYTNELSKAILIFLAVQSLGWGDRCNIALASLGLLAGYDGGSALDGNDAMGLRRRMIAHHIHYVGEYDNIQTREADAYKRMIEYYYNSNLDDSEKMEKFIEEVRQSAFYDRDSERAVLPSPAPSSGTEESILLHTKKITDHKRLISQKEIAIRTIEIVVPIILMCGVIVIAYFKLGEKFGTFIIMSIMLLALIIAVMLWVLIYIKSNAASYHYRFEIRLKGQENWQPDLFNVHVGDIVEMRLTFTNDFGGMNLISRLFDRLGLALVTKDISVKFDLDPGIELIGGSTFLVNRIFRSGVKIGSNDVVTKGLNIGDCMINDTVYLSVKCRVVENNLDDGSNAIVAHAWIDANKDTGVDSVSVHVVHEE